MEWQHQIMAKLLPRTFCLEKYDTKFHEYCNMPSKSMFSLHLGWHICIDKSIVSRCIWDKYLNQYFKYNKLQANAGI